LVGSLGGAADVAEIDLGVSLDARQEQQEAGVQRMQGRHGQSLLDRPRAEGGPVVKPDRPGNVLQAVSNGVLAVIDT
jgi:hypothetical protein